MYIHNVYTEIAMTKEYRAKVFKSGNSLALRLPKALGIEEGTEMIVREERGEYRFEPADKPRAKIDVSGFAGKAPGLKLAPREDFEERPSSIAARKAAEAAEAVNKA
ncbi:AbrB/MazE/SpoVT family DNA-binding domain-containing protein [Sphingopyxis lindanitolerans]|uniref:AbrB/MazE/SpoVT family DNA-binding domain-containing protein n=2 Tax=Sphingopyxis lindanitolerans TaxID=2054227 RepID=A0A2S8B1A3_9SPHN|nr:AbrB/MazE/SpoVT family DNA-binding domain-containing protein [Sphingopyxis lindanitolerans]